MKLRVTLAELALLCEKCATYQDPGYGSTPDEATKQALEEVLPHHIFYVVEKNLLVETEISLTVVLRGP